MNRIFYTLALIAVAATACQKESFEPEDSGKIAVDTVEVDTVAVDTVSVVDTLIMYSEPFAYMDITQKVDKKDPFTGTTYIWNGLRGSSSELVTVQLVYNKSMYDWSEVIDQDKYFEGYIQVPDNLVDDIISLFPVEAFNRLFKVAICCSVPGKYDVASKRFVQRQDSVWEKKYLLDMNFMEGYLDWMAYTYIIANWEKQRLEGCHYPDGEDAVMMAREGLVGLTYGEVCYEDVTGAAKYFYNPENKFELGYVFSVEVCRTKNAQIALNIAKHH